MSDQALREHVTALIRWEDAHAGIDQIVDGVPADRWGADAPGLPCTLWQLLEHLRLVQSDILDFCRNPGYGQPRWPEGYWPAAAIAIALYLLLPGAATAQRDATPDDFLGLTSCEAGTAVTKLRPDVRDSMLVAEIEAHESVHREQAAAHETCDAFLATLTSARRIIDAELPAYCAQWKIAVARGADSAITRREFAWRIAAQSGAMENRLQVAQRFEEECK